ncbi:PSD1 and planctomycete cytochrome C domain-containing protein [Planctomycetaceae bacterium SH139]
MKQLSVRPAANPQQPMLTVRQRAGTFLVALASITLCSSQLPGPQRCLAQDGSSTAAESEQTTEAAAAPVSFANQIQGILAKRCYACHGPDQAESGLRLSDAEGAFAETDSGEVAIVAGSAETSPLFARITSADEWERMPPEGEPLSEEETDLIRRWINQGAEWESHWAFEPRRAVQPPPVDNPQWAENPLDAFVLARLNDAGLQPNEPASRRSLIRRAYYDLLGLPPTAAQIEAFVQDPSPDAWPRLIDELLASHHYGEKWGRYWLDLVRYGETNSYERDNPKPNVWKYRDYVIRAFNEDKPYDQFVREQLAGDELENVTEDSLIATGFYRLGIWDDEPADPLQARYDELDDLVTTAGQVFLGLTINCARCHDHKIDPIPQTDYYGMLAFFADVTPYGTRGNQTRNNQIEISPPHVQEGYRQLDREQRELDRKLKELEQLGIAKMPAPDQRATEGPANERKKVLEEKLADHLEADQWTEYQALQKRRQEIDKERAQLPAREYVLGLANCDATPEPTKLMIRGNPHVPGDVVQPRFPELFAEPLPEIAPPAEGASTAGRRRVLADWITAPENRLTSRVMANRLWQFHFGRGLVRSSNNFGQLGSAPTHPLLLDFLANQLILRGWSLKAMHRLIMTSQVYQLSSLANSAGLAKDPGNDLFWRYDQRRLSAEEVRDSILAAVGQLNPQPYGPSFYPQLSAEVLAGQSRPGAGWGNSSPEQRNRRSIYIHVKRSLLTPILSVFDYPEPDRTCEARFATLQPGQALSLLNSGFIHEQADRMAARVQSLAGEQRTARIDQAIRLALGRPATAEETAEGQALIQEMMDDFGLNKEESLKLYCLTVLNWNEFLFID